MIALLDTSELVATAEKEIGMECGELLTPLTRRRWEGRRFGIDNGAFARFDAKGFRSLLKRHKDHQDKCLFVAVPDVVGCARRTMEVFRHWQPELAEAGWPLAMVAQNGQENLDIPWHQISAIFIGGTFDGRADWKLSQHAEAIIKAAKAMEKWVHVGRVNTPERMNRFAELGVDSIDGTGIGKYSHMRQKLAAWQNGPPLFASSAVVEFPPKMQSHEQTGLDAGDIGDVCLAGMSQVEIARIFGAEDER